MLQADGELSGGGAAVSTSPPSAPAHHQVHRHNMLSFVTSSTTFFSPAPVGYLHLFQRDLKAEGLVVVGVQRVLLHGRLLLLQTLAVLQQVDLHVRIWK